MRQLQEVRPEFSFYEHDQLWLQRPQVRPYREREIHVKVKNVLRSKTFAGKFLASVGRGRNQHAMLRKAVPHLLNQSSCGKNLSQRNRVNPNDAALLNSMDCDARWNTAKALEKSRAIFAMAKYLVQPIRRTHQHSHREHETVKEIAQAGAILNC